MKQLLNTLFVTTQGAYVSKEGECLVVSVDRQERLRVPILNLAGLVCLGNIHCSHYVLGHCADNGVAVSFLTEWGRFLARVVGPVSGNVLLRRRQYRAADDPVASAIIARGCVIGKTANSRSVLLRVLRDHADRVDVAALEVGVRRLGRILVQLRQERQLDVVRGVEGDASRVYFETFDALITCQKEDFYFRERSRRPPLDSLNAMLSFAYTLLMHDCIGALEAVGLDPQVGFLHRDRPGRASLALDLMEEFRAFVADRLAVTLVNLRQVQARDFEQSESGAVHMKDDARKSLIVAYQKRKQEEVRHPFLDETMRIGLLPYAQALLLARHLRGDLEGYPPFLLK